MLSWGRDQTLTDEAVDRTRLIEGHETCHRLAVISHGHLVSFSHDVEVTTEVVSKFSNASFHGFIMALYCQLI